MNTPRYRWLWILCSLILAAAAVYTSYQVLIGALSGAEFFGRLGILIILVGVMVLAGIRIEWPAEKREYSSAYTLITVGVIIALLSWLLPLLGL